MRTAEPGDRVSVHFVKRAQNGGVSTSRGRAPLELTVGTDHRRLPGLGRALVGLSEGERVRILVPPDQAYGLPSPKRVRRLPRSRFAEGQDLSPGQRVRVRCGRGRRLVRVVEVRDNAVVVDANHPWAGQTLALEVELVAIHGPAAGEPDAASRSADQG